jgi:glycosyltransferase involved in cell wall biosynthesis
MPNRISKTLLISTYFFPIIGGAETYLYNVYSRLDAEQIFVLAQTNKTSLEADFDGQQKFKIWRTEFFSGKFKPTWWPLIKQVRKIVDNYNIETLHFGHYAHYVLLGRWLKISYVVYFHGTDLYNYSKSWWGRQLMKFNLAKAEKIVVASQFLKDKILKIYNQPTKIQVIHPGINLADFVIKETKHDIRQKMAIDSGVKVIISAGHLHYIKGFDLGIKAVAELIKAGHSINYFILGGAGDAQADLQKMILDLGLSKRVFLVGEVSNRFEYAKYFKMADLYLGPSRREGFGIVFLEAQANGLPIVASFNDGVSEAVGEGAILFRIEDSTGLEKAILEGLAVKSAVSDISELDWGQKLAKFKKVLYNV